MTAERSATAAPQWAITIWCDLTRIYIQLPSTHGPCIIEYPRDAHGLSDVLNLMKTRHATEGFGEIYHKPINPLYKPKVPLAPKSQELLRELIKDRKPKP